MKFNGEILSLCTDNNIRKKLYIDTLKTATVRFPICGAILHFVCGSQYASAAFWQELKNCSVAHCHDIARIESFFATLKAESLYRIPAYRMTMDEVKTLLFRYVFIYYNQYRVYTSISGGPPLATFRISALDYVA